MMPTQLVVLDIDRTLLKTTNFSRQIARPLGVLFGLSDKQISDMTEVAVQSEGMSFDYLEWIGRAISLDTDKHTLLHDPVQIAQAIIDFHTDKDGTISPQFISEVIVDDIDIVLTAIQDIHAKVLLLTAGGAVLQSVKAQVIYELVRSKDAKLAGLLTDYVVVSTSQPKTRLLKECFDATHLHIDDLVARAVISQIADVHIYDTIERCTVIDDKYSNIISVDDVRILGILAWIEGEEGRSEYGERENLERQSLAQIAVRLRS